MPMPGTSKIRHLSRPLQSERPSRPTIDQSAPSDSAMPACGQDGFAEAGPTAPQFAGLLRKFADLFEPAVRTGLQAARAAGWHNDSGDEARIQSDLAELLRVALCRSASKHLFCNAHKAPRRGAVSAYIRRLHVEDLALAAACSAGHEPAWEYFVAQYRPVLRAAARAIVGGDPAAGDELVDLLWAELYGVRGSDTSSPEAEPAVRRPLLDYFHGRSSLATWLRAVLAQRHVDAIRASRRTMSLEDDRKVPRATCGNIRTDHSRAVSPAQEIPDPDRAQYVAMFEQGLCAALESLEPRERLRITYYYVHELTLAQIGRLLGEHEATASRHLERTRRRIRKYVEQALRDAPRLSHDPPGRKLFHRGKLNQEQVQLCLRYAIENLSLDLRGLLVAADSTTVVPGPARFPSPTGTPKPESSAREGRKIHPGGRSTYRSET